MLVHTYLHFYLLFRHLSKKRHGIDLLGKCTIDEGKQFAICSMFRGSIANFGTFLIWIILMSIVFVAVGGGLFWVCVSRKVNSLLPVSDVSGVGIIQRRILRNVLFLLL